MDILLCKQGIFGGTDKLLSRLYQWLIENSYSTDRVCVDEVDTDELKDCYDIAILPSSQLGDIDLLADKRIEVKRVLIWIMGMGAFSDSYYNYPPTRLFDRILHMMYAKESKKTLQWLIRNDSIVFTDSVGIYNTYKSVGITIPEEIDDNIFPIAVSTPERNVWDLGCSNRKNNIIHIAWVGRVSSDFKEIPLSHLIDDISEYIQSSEVSIELTIIGDGDAVGSIKKKALDTKYKIDFIDSIPYEGLNDYFVNYVDLLIAMGTSALDGAKAGCPTVVITPVRPTDPNRVAYRWIYDSVGYSLGEYPDLDIETGQRRADFMKIMKEYLYNGLISDRCFEYAQKFSADVVFNKLINRKQPNCIDAQMKDHIRKFQILKKRKSAIKKILKRR